MAAERSQLDRRPGASVRGPEPAVTTVSRQCPLPAGPQSQGPASASWVHGVVVWLSALQTKAAWAGAGPACGPYALANADGGPVAGQQCHVACRTASQGRWWKGALPTAVVVTPLGSAGCSGCGRMRVDAGELSSLSTFPSHKTAPSGQWPGRQDVS